jgi:thymidine kinase
MAKLDLIIGPMFSGKTTELIKRIREAHTAKKKYLVIKPSIDKRYTENDFISSHNKDMEHCISVNKLFELYSHESIDLYKFDIVFIDEGQFFSDLLYFTKDLVEEHNIDVVVSSLDGDFKRDKFGDVLELIPLCDSVEKKKAMCMHCDFNSPAIFSHKFNKTSNQIDVGSSDKYEPLCRKHFLMFNQ